MRVAVTWPVASAACSVSSSHATAYGLSRGAPAATRVASAVTLPVAPESQR